MVNVVESTPGDLSITLDRNALRGAGRIAIGNFLLKLQVYKATGNIEAAKELFNRYSEVVEPWLSWRSIILANKQPRKMLVQCNTALKGDDVQLKTYEGSVQGLIMSNIERFEEPEAVYGALLELSKADRSYFK